MSPVTGAGPFRSRALGQMQQWICPTCQAENVTPFEEGCPQCGMGTPAKQRQPVGAARQRRSGGPPRERGGAEGFDSPPVHQQQVIAEVLDVIERLQLAPLFERESLGIIERLRDALAPRVERTPPTTTLPAGLTEEDWLIILVALEGLTDGLRRGTPPPGTPPLLTIERVGDVIARIVALPDLVVADHVGSAPQETQPEPQMIDQGDSDDSRTD